MGKEIARRQKAEGSRKVQISQQECDKMGANVEG
jgi:hypothetical protein